MLQKPALPANPLDLVLKAVRRHPFFLGALLIHGGALWMLSQLHVQGLVEANRVQIQAHTQAAQQHGMRRRVDRPSPPKGTMPRPAPAPRPARSMPARRTCWPRPARCATASSASNRPRRPGRWPNC
jgi:hypothetical protein